MKVHHVVTRAIKAPDTTKVYGAKVEGIRLNGNSATIEWGIFAHKPRVKRNKKGA